MTSLIYILLLSYLLKFFIVETQPNQVDLSSLYDNNPDYFQAFQRLYYLSNPYYKLLEMRDGQYKFNQTQTTSTQSVQDTTLSTSKQIYPLFFNDYGLQGESSFALYEHDKINNLITIRVFFYQVGQAINTIEVQYQGIGLLHCSVVQDRTSFNQDNYYYYIQKSQDSVFLVAILPQFNPKIYNMGIPANFKFFYQNFFAKNDECLYEISLSKQFQKLVVNDNPFCLDQFGDQITSMQYTGGNVKLIFGIDNVYAFQYGTLKNIQPKTQYIIFYVKQSTSTTDTIIDINSVGNSLPQLNEIEFNFGAYLSENYLIICQSESKNIQQMKYLYKLNIGAEQILQLYLDSSQGTDIYALINISSLNPNGLFYTNAFDTKTGNVEQIQYLLNSSYTNKLQNSQDTNNTIMLWILNGFFLVFGSLYFYLIIKRKKKSILIKQQMEALLFSTKFEMNRIQFNSKYKIDLGEPLGSGGFGDVYKASNLHKQFIKNKQILEKMQDEFACKRIIINKQKPIEQQLKPICNEIEILLKLSKYPNIISLKNFCIDQDETFITFELAESNLQKLIVQKQSDQKKFSEEEIVKFLDQIGRTLADIYLTENIAHRDIKPDNILIKDGNYYLADFGISSLIDRRKVQKDNLVLGTLKWMSPEIKHQNTDDEQTENADFDYFQSDMFSFGMVLLFMLTLFDIAQVNDDDKLKRDRLRGLKLNRSSDIDEQIIMLVSKLLNFSPEKRPDAHILTKAIDDIVRKHKQSIIETDNLQL